MTTEQKITARIQTLESELDKFVITANQQIAAYQAVIGELEKLLEPEENLEEEKDE